MIVGYDSCKSKGGMRFVITATYNDKYSKFYSEKFKLKNDTNNVGPIGDMLYHCLQNFKSKNNIFPQRVIIFRSGTSEYEKKLYNLEINQILEMESNLKLNIKFTYLHVNKKTTLKFFESTTDKENRTSYCNPSSGLIVDSGITNPDKYEFYIQPQFVAFNCGTATPVHYEVLYDSIELETEELQKLCFYLCFYYWNWDGPVRLPAPLKFAETNNAFVSKTDNEGVTHPNLVNSPYFI